MIDFSGRRGVVFGVANQRSIATAVARQLHALGAELALTYGPDPKGRFEQNVRELAGELSPARVLPADVRDDAAIEAVFRELAGAWDGLDFVVHSVAYADRADLEAPFSNTSRQGWLVAQDVSAYSIVPMARCAAPLMRKRGGGALVGMTFIGSVLAVPQYHVMGPAKAALEAAVRYLARELGPDNIRCNAVSAGALRTLSSSGIKNFGDMLKVAGEHAALARNVTAEEIAQATAFLLSPAASGITGQCIYVDAGYNIMAN
jgi:enoyl-[acyl-carrier protein] reductase I